MTLHEIILDLLTKENIKVSEWLITEDGKTLIRPPYVCICDVEGYGVYADGKLAIPIEAVKIHVVYTPTNENFFEQVKGVLSRAGYGYKWEKEKLTAERVMIGTLTVEG